MRVISKIKLNKNYGPTKKNRSYFCDSIKFYRCSITKHISKYHHKADEIEIKTKYAPSEFY